MVFSLLAGDDDIVKEKMRERERRGEKCRGCLFSMILLELSSWMQ